MLDALISGKLIKDCQLKTSQNNKLYCQFLLSLGVGEPENIVVSAIAFGGHAERVAQLKKGDAVSVIGALKPTEWEDKAKLIDLEELGERLKRIEQQLKLREP